MSRIVKLGKFLFKGWMKFAHALGWVNTRILLVLFFFLIITPVSLFMRMIGKDLLSRRIEPELETYWNDREDHSFDRSSYSRQF
jgi:multisubunit Na+/H+ antiporter MnhG subunit